MSDRRICRSCGNVAKYEVCKKCRKDTVKLHRDDVITNKGSKMSDNRKPVAFVIFDEDENPAFVTKTNQEAQDHINEVIMFHEDNIDASKWKAKPVYL